MGKSYDEVNITASDYTVYLNVTAVHRHEFQEKWGNRLNTDSQFSRGYFFKKFITEKLQYQDTTIARIDLVFDNKKMITLLESRGAAIKNCDYKSVFEIED